MLSDSSASSLSVNAHDAACLDLVLQQLLEGDFQTRWEATKHLAVLGKPAIAALVSLLEDDELDWEVRWFSARALGQFEDPEALDALIQVLRQTQEPELITITAEGLSRHGENAVNALVPFLEVPSHRVAVVQALAQIRHKTVLIPLLAAAQDDLPEVRAMAIAALGNFRGAPVDDLLLKAAQDPNAAVRKEAITYLGLRPHLLDTVNLVEQLMSGLWDINAQVNQATAIALSRLGTDHAIAGLIQVLQSPHTPEPLQIDIVRALGWANQPTGISALSAFWPEASTAVKLEIVEAMTRLEAPNLRQQANDALCEWLSGLLEEPEKGKLKQAIALALGDLHSIQARPLLQSLAQNTDPQTSLYAQAALRQLSAI